MAGIEQRDLFPISQGSIYEQTNTSYKNCWNLVISDNSFHQLMNNAIVVLVKVDDGADAYDSIHVKFESRGILYKILPENIFNLSKNKLGNYIGTVSADVLKQTLTMVQKLIFGEQLYTLSEARWNLADRDIALRAKYGQEAVVADVAALQISQPIKSVDNAVAMNRKESKVKMSLEDEMQLFASTQDDFTEEELEETCNEDSEEGTDSSELEFVPSACNPENEILYSIDNETEVVPVVLEKESPQPKTIVQVVEDLVKEEDPRISMSYDEYKKAFNDYFLDEHHVEDFLMDYYSMDLDDCKAKYPWIRSEFFYVAQKCRKLYVKNGGDKTIIDELVKDKRQKAAKMVRERTLKNKGCKTK